MSLDFYIEGEEDSFNITHNCNRMADVGGFYAAVWRPEDLWDRPKAENVIPLLEKGIHDMVSNPEKYEAVEPDNGCGTYDQFLPWCCRLLRALKKDPSAAVSASR